MGRDVVFQDTGNHMVQTHIVSDQLMAKLVDLLRQKSADKSDSLKSFGTLQFAVLRQTKVDQAIILNRANSLQTLEKFAAIAGQGELEKKLTYMRSQVSMLPK